MPYDCDRIMEIANRYDIPVVEDAAEGFGSRWKGQVLGTFGKFGVLSFNGNKMITTSGGGALICRDRKSTRLNSSHANISYAVFCLNKKSHGNTGSAPFSTLSPSHSLFSLCRSPIPSILFMSSPSGHRLLHLPYAHSTHRFWRCPRH